jgi:hypothetical protein
MKQKKVASVRVALDDNVPEEMTGILRCGSVISEDEDGNEIADHQELIDNREFHSEAALVAYVAKRLKVDPAIVLVEE